MSLYALINGERARAERHGPRQASCPECGTTMVPKTGDVIVWHWAHKSRPHDCAAAYESEWHLEWKSMGIEGTQEIKVGNRRADILAPGGYAVEFQASTLTWDEVAEREQDWNRKLVWIFDAREAATSERLRVLSDDPSEPRCGLFWYRAPQRIKGASCLTILDIGFGELILVGRLSPTKSSLKGYGWVVPKEWVIKYVLHGHRMPTSQGINWQIVESLKQDEPTVSPASAEKSPGDDQLTLFPAESDPS